MPTFEMTDVEATPYLYEERSCSMDPEDIGRTMGEAFQSVMGFMQSHGIAPAGEVLSVYYTYDPEKMTFRAGVSVSADAMAKAEGAVKAAQTPAGRVLTFTHVGPYSGLRDSYSEMMTYLEKNELKIGAPTWEVYLNDPRAVPEDELKTQVFVSLA